MGGISAGVGLFSGINTQQLIGQLLAIEARPKVLIQQRVAQLQQQQAAYLDLNSRLSGLRDAAAAFRTGKVFQSKKASSSNPDILSATASANATPGSYQFIVDRLVSNQQLLSRGFASSTNGLGSTGFTFESAAARLDRDTKLADLNGGAGIERGKIVIAVQGGSSETVDLSRVGTVSELLDAINSTGLGVTASISDHRLVLTHSGGSSITVTSAAGYNTAASLGIERTTFSGATITGSEVYRLGASTALKSLNDGNGVFIGNQAGSPSDFTIKITDGATSTNVTVNLGTVYDSQQHAVASPVTTAGGVLERINGALAAAGFNDITASIRSDGTGFQLIDAQGTRTLRITENATTSGNTADDLGFATDQDFVGTVTGERVLAGLNSTLARTLNGGSGIAGDGTISITDRLGNVHAVTINTRDTVSQILKKFSTDTGGAVTAALDAKGTGIVLTDTTGGTGNLIVSGASAASLGVQTDPGGVTAATLSSGNLQHQYMTVATRLSSLNGGAGVGTGVFIITDSTGATSEVTVSENQETLGDLIKLINSRPTRIKARLNDRGDGLELYEEAGGGTQKIKVEDRSGGVARALNIKGEAPGTGVQNIIDGSFERTVTFDPTDGLAKIVEKINKAGIGVAATIINDGSGATPFRLSLTASGTGTAGRFIIDTGLSDMGLTTLDGGQDSRVFFGSSDPARAVLLSNSTNTLDNVLTGVTIDLNGTSATPVSLSVTRDTTSIESSVAAFVDAFNGLMDRVAQQTRYVQDTNQRGPLLGDSTAINLRSALFSTVQSAAKGLTGRFTNLAQVGVTVGKGGKLELDREALRSAIELDPQAVADVFSARVARTTTGTISLPGGGTARDPNAKQEFDQLGVGSMIEELAKTYVDTVDGILTGRAKTLSDQIDQQNQRISDLDARLESRRQVLQRQFLAMEQAIGHLQSQQGALASIGSMGR
jgi:flagellar hook-associated protein 2